MGLFDRKKDKKEEGIIWYDDENTNESLAAETFRKIHGREPNEKELADMEKTIAEQRVDYPGFQFEKKGHWEKRMVPGPFGFGWKEEQVWVTD